MNQTKLGSLIETMVNIAIGFIINLGANLVILPAFGYQVSLGQAFYIGLAFTGISVLRGYLIRRYFNAKLHSLSLRASAALGK